MTLYGTGEKRSATSALTRSCIDWIGCVGVLARAGLIGLTGGIPVLGCGGEDAEGAAYGSGRPDSGRGRVCGGTLAGVRRVVRAELPNGMDAEQQRIRRCVHEEVCGVPDIGRVRGGGQEAGMLMRAYL